MNIMIKKEIIESLTEELKQFDWFEKVTAGEQNKEIVLFVYVRSVSEGLRMPKSWQGYKVIRRKLGHNRR